jgi:hypothetical protein
MKKSYLLALTGLTLALGAGCSKKSQQTVAPNTLSLDLNGSAFPVDFAASSLAVDQANRTITIIAKGQDGITQIMFRGQSSNPNGLFVAQKFNPTSQGGASGETVAQYLTVYNNYYSCLGRTLSGTQTYESTLCNHPDNIVINLQTVDQSAHTMSGTFSGTCCKNANPCDDKVVTNGRFNLTY